MATLLQANDKYRATLRSVFIDGVDTSFAVTAIPANLPTIVTLGWNTATQAVFKITGTSGTTAANYTLTGVTKLKGYAGNQAEGTAVNCLNHEEYFNQYSDEIDALVDGSNAYVADTGAADAMVVTQDPAPLSYVTGMFLNVKATATNTTTTTINVNGLGVKTIKKLHNQNLEAGDIEAGQVITIVYDGTNFQMQSQIANTPTPAPTDGWTPSSDTWTYASASTFTIAGVDRTTTFTKGTRLKFTQTTAKYAVVVSSSFSTNTTVTIAVNTDHVIANAAITAPYYSYQISPQGYPTWFAYTPTYTGFSVDPASPMKYKIEADLVTVDASAATNGTSNSANFTFTVPLGAVSAVFGVGQGYDNGTYPTGGASCHYINGTTCNVYKLVNQIGGWTTSGQKGYYALVSYRY